MRFLLLTALAAVANAECFGSGGLTICDKATLVRFTLEIGGGQGNSVRFPNVDGATQCDAFSAAVSGAIAESEWTAEVVGCAAGSAIITLSGSDAADVAAALRSGELQVDGFDTSGAGCDDSVAADISSNASSYFTGDEYTMKGGGCSADFKSYEFSAILGVSNIEKAQKMDTKALFNGVSFLDVEVGGAQPSGDVTEPPIVIETLCGGDDVYVSGTLQDNGPYKEDLSGANPTYTMGGNAIFRSGDGGSWKIQTSEGVYDSGNDELRTGEFGNGVHLSCDQASLVVEELRQKIAQLEKDKDDLRLELGVAEEAKRSSDLAKQAADNAANAVQGSLDECNASLEEQGCECPDCPEIPKCPDPEPCEVCPVIPDDCPSVQCPVPDPCPDCEDCGDCPAQGCYNDMSSPVKFGSDYWFCDELLPSDCDHEIHGENVNNACRALCGSCGEEVCAEKYHTKVLIEEHGSMYCDQLYPEECQIPEVKATCCRTCS